MSIKATDPDVKFDASYIPVTESGCWIWQAAMATNGYGELQVNGKPVGAHRYSYERYRGPLKPRMHIDHLCRVPCCVNPYHLEQVSSKVNILRGIGPSAVNARKTHCNMGHPLIGGNLVVKRGERNCRTCMNERASTYRSKRRDPKVSEIVESHKREVASRVFTGTRKLKSVCKRGHILNSENVLVVNRPNHKQERQCRACNAERARQYRKGKQ